MNDQTTEPVNDITALRTVLFDTLNRLSDQDNPMELDRALAIKDVAQTIVNSAKVEVDALKVIGGNGSGFIPVPPPVKPSRGIDHPKPGITRHTPS